MAMDRNADEAAALRRLDQRKLPTVESASFDIKSSVFFKNNWDTLLSAAPNCLELLGTCMIASSTELAQSATLSPPLGGFKYLKGYQYLGANLVEVHNRGSAAFRIARVSMGRIHQSSGSVTATVRQLVQMLNQPKPPISLVEVQLRRLAAAAKDCQTQAIRMDETFVDWLNFVSELHEACQEQSGKTTKSLSENSLLLKVADDSVKASKDHEDRTREVLETLKEQLENHRKLYEHSVKSGKSQMLREVLTGVGEAVASSINIAVMSMASATTACTSVFGGGISVPAPGPVLSAVGKTASNILTTAKVVGKLASAAAQKKKKPVFDFMDSALACVPELRVFILELRSIIDGDGGVNWERITKVAGKEGSLGSHAEVNFRLASMQREFVSSEDNRASVKLSALFDRVLKLSNEIKEEGNRSADLNWKKPSEDDEKVKRWHTDIAVCANDVEELYTAYKSIPGIAAGGMPSFTALPPAPEGKSRRLGRRALKARTAKLFATQRAYLATLETYKKANDHVIKTQEGLMKARAHIEHLRASGITLEEVRRVLLSCIGFLISLKEKIQMLANFFGALSMIVDSACEDQVKPFKETVEAYVGGLAGDDALAEHFKYFRDMIAQFMVTIYAYFGLFKDVTAMYLDVDRQYIEPGVKLIDVLGIPDSGDADGAEARLQKRKADLSNHAKEAEGGIHVIVKQKQDEIIGALEKRIHAIASQMELIPVHLRSDPETVLAIGRGADAAQVETEALATEVDAVELMSRSVDDIMGGDDDDDLPDYEQE